MDFSDFPYGIEGTGDSLIWLPNVKNKLFSYPRNTTFVAQVSTAKLRPLCYTPKLKPSMKIYYRDNSCKFFARSNF